MTYAEEQVMIEWLDGPPGYPQGARVRKVQAEGNGSSGILALGEAPGEHEDHEGLPFRPYAEAGGVLERALYRARVDRASLTLANVVNYRPPRNWLDGAPWEREALSYCSQDLQDLIQRVQPRVILALGGVAFRELTGMSGEKCGIEMTRGFQVQDVHGHALTVVGTYHPSFLRRGSKGRDSSPEQGKTVSAGGGTKGMALLGVMIRDIQLAADVAKNGPAKMTKGDWRLGASLDDWESLSVHARENPGEVIVYDFETRDSIRADDESEMEITVREVTQVQVGCGRMICISAWSPDLLPVFRDLMALPNPKLDWNGRKFDRPIARDMGVVFHGHLHDGMDLWHHAQPDLPRGLQYATSFFAPEIGPWKHLGAQDPLWYGALDIHAPMKVYEGLRSSLPMVKEIHSGVSLWEGYQEQVVALSPVLDDMSNRGIPVDENRRVALDQEFTATLARIHEDLQARVPEVLKNVSPKSGYVRPPEEVLDTCDVCMGEKKILVQVPGAKKAQKIPCPECLGRGKVESENMALGSGLVKREFQDEVKCSCAWAKSARKGQVEIPPNCAECNNTGKRLWRGTRWAQVQPFLPGSWQQVLRYVKFKRDEDIQALRTKWLTRHPLDMPYAMKYAEDHTTWKIPTEYKSGRETTEESGLRRLAAKTGDDVLPLVLEYREVAKARGTYVQGWKPSADGRVHSTFGFKPATGQLSSEEPNAQNFPAHGELAKAMKAMIHAPGENKIVAFDYKSFHVLTLGFEAQDPLYMRAARIDMHSFFALAGMLRLERPDALFALPDDELKAKLKWYRKQPRAFPAFGGATFEEIRNEKAKRCILGIGFGQGPVSMYRLNPEAFSGVGEAQQCLDMLNSLFPLPEKWRERVKLQADDAHQLVSRHGFVRRFWDVFGRKVVADNYQPKGHDIVRMNAKGQKILFRPGDDAEAAIAFLPANDAFGTIRGVMVKVHAQGLSERYGLTNQIHDSLVFDCPGAKVEECIQVIKGMMETPNPRLKDPLTAPEGLSCKVDVKVGKDLATMEEI